MKGGREPISIGSCPIAMLRLFPVDSDPMILETAECSPMPSRVCQEGLVKEAAILVVDDDSMVRRTIAQLLAKAPYAVTTVADGREALELFRNSDFDLVITDYRMPEMTGGELAAELKARQPSVPVCLVTGVVGDVAADELSHFSAILEKPFDRETLAGTVADLLDRAQRRVHVPRAPRFAVDWRLDYIPLAAPFLAGRELEPKRGVLCNLSADGLAFEAKDSRDEPFCAFLIYPPASTSPSLMIGEIIWRREQAGRKLAGTKSLFWGSERERALAVEQAM